MGQQKDVCKAGSTAFIRDLKRKQDSKGKSKSTGIGCTYLQEPLPHFNRARCEKVTAHKDSWIVLGRDRPAERHVAAMGYGNKGHTQSHMIDLVVGRNASALRCGLFEEENEDGFAVPCNPNFKTDAARIYISQKTDVDDYFGLVPGKVRNKKGRSCVALKADGVRIMAREGIKIVSGMDDRNSRGEMNAGKAGVDLIYGNQEKGNDYELEPMLKGLRTKAALGALLDIVLSNTGMIADLCELLLKLSGSYAAHSHIGNIGAPTPGTSQIPDGITAVLKAVEVFTTKAISQQTNFASFKTNRLEIIGAEYICSKWHHLN